MTTKEYPNHTQFKTGLQRIIAESVAETLNETDHEIAAAWRGVLQGRQRRPESSTEESNEHKLPQRPSSTRERH